MSKALEMHPRISKISSLLQLLCFLLKMIFIEIYSVKCTSPLGKEYYCVKKDLNIINVFQLFEGDLDDAVLVD